MTLQPNPVVFDRSAVSLKPNERIDVYNDGLPCDYFEHGSNCATLTLQENVEITVHVDPTSDFASGGFWVKIGGTSFMPTIESPTKTFTINAGTHNVSFDCTLHAQSSFDEPADRTVTVWIKSEQAIGSIQLKYHVEP